MIGGLLKSSGRVTCQSSEMYYQLYLNDQRYILKYYDDAGKQRVARPLALPAQNIEIHVIGEHLVAYHQLKDSPQKGQILLLQLSNLRSISYSLKFAILASGQNTKLINQLYRVTEYDYIIFSDLENNVYILNWNNCGELACKMILKHVQDIKRISVDQNDDIVLIGASGAYKISLDWGNIKFEDDEEINVVDEQLDENIIDYFRSEKYVLHYTKLRKLKKPNGRVVRSSQQQEFQEDTGSYYLHIDEAGKIDEQSYCSKFQYEFSKGQLIISAGKQWLLIFNKSDKIIFTLFNNMQYVTVVEDNLMSRLEPNNFIASFKTDSNFNVLLEVRVFDLGVINTLYTYEISLKNGNEHKVYLKNNLHLIFTVNGLPSPDYQMEARKELAAFLNSSEYKNSRQSRISEELQAENPTLNSFELGKDLLRCGLLHFPRSLDRIARKLRWSVFYNKNTAYIRQSHRYFDYCQAILNQIENPLLIISKNQQESIDNGDSIIQSRDKEELKKIKQLLENMVAFLHLILLALNEQLNETFKLERKAEPERQLQKKMQEYQKVLNSAKSLNLICCLLDDENNAKRCQQCFRDLKRKEKQFKTNWEEKQTIIIKQYQPLMAQQYFSYSYRCIYNKNSIQLYDLILAIIANRTCFLQNAYYFQAVNRQAVTPYLQSDLCDLIENMLFHLKFEKIKESRDLLTKMVGIVLRSKTPSFAKFLIQQSIYQQQYKLAILLLASKILLINSQNEQSRFADKVFIIQSFILSKRLDFAHIFLLENYEEGLSEVLVRAGAQCGYSAEIVEISQNSFLPLSDGGKLQEMLGIGKQKWSLIDKK